MPIKCPSLPTTGNERKPYSSIKSIAYSADMAGVTVTGVQDMHFPTRKFPHSLVGWAATSVLDKMPTRFRCSSMTGR